MSSVTIPDDRTGLEIAIVGMAGRFPGANDIDTFWRNLRDGVESIAFFSTQELLSSGVEPNLVEDPNYVPAMATIEDVELFDAPFFGYSPREAQILDPQQRLFLECAWEALENAGYVPEGLIGVYAGVSRNSYLLNNLLANPEVIQSIGSFQTLIANDKDYLSTRVSYKFNLEGPSLTVQTACSTSLVATHLACQALLSGDCNMALAGGVTISIPQKAGYVYQSGGIASPDGHCRAFDARAEGTVGGNGVGVVVLKRLEDALADGDQIYAVIKGSAINNDGALKAGYTAPRIDGQAKAIRAAQVMAGVKPETISYVQCHGTGTPLGDPIEIAALTQAFRASTDKKQFCAIGSVKSNIGHLDAAAGVAGLIETALALKHKLLPPSLHFEAPNPQIDFVDSPFYVNSRLAAWQPESLPRRAGVSSFGIGGTNAHAILEEAPSVAFTESARPWHLLVLSAKTDSALEAMTQNLARHLKAHPDICLADVAHTLQVGRKAFSRRRILVARDVKDAIQALESKDPTRLHTAAQEPADRPVVFMFPGQGAQYVDMGRELYQTEQVFREQIDRCAELLKPHLGLDLRAVLYPEARQGDKETRRQGDIPTEISPSPLLPFSPSELDQTALTQPALFVVEYALAQLWMSWGVEPEAMIGHSVGEYVAACLAGVFSLEDALALVAARGRLMQALPPGAMLSVSLPAEQVQPLLGEQLSLAAVNGPALCVVSGPVETVDALHQQLTERGVHCRRLHTSHAFHSAMVAPILEHFTRQVASIRRSAPRIPFVSNLTGTWISAAEATDPAYWARHLRQTVLFEAGIRELLAQPDRLLLEVGPGRTLSTFARQQRAADRPLALASLRHAQMTQSDVAFALNTLGQLWLAGKQVSWARLYADERRPRIALPTYPFERQPYWIEPQQRQTPIAHGQPSLHKAPDLADWFYIPFWKPTAAPAHLTLETQAAQTACWLVLSDDHGLGEQLARRLEQAGRRVVTVHAGREFARLDRHTYTIDPRSRGDYDALFADLQTADQLPTSIAHLWTVGAEDQAEPALARFERTQDLGFSSLLSIVQALVARRITDPLPICVISNGMQTVGGEACSCPEKATLLGACKVIPQEYPHITCRSVDILRPAPGTRQEDILLDQLLAELGVIASDRVVAYRGNQRWVQSFTPHRLDATAVPATPLREHGVYLIADGLSGGMPVMLEVLAKTAGAKLALVEPAPLPPREQWQRLLEQGDSAELLDKIRTVLRLEVMGAEVMVLAADVASQEQMERAISLIHERFGALHGVVYAASFTHGRLLKGIEEARREEYAAHLRSRAAGLLALDRVLRGQALDFCLMQSSLSAILGGLGFATEAAAMAFVDAFAQRQQRELLPWMSVNWDIWRLGEDKGMNPAIGATLADLGITPPELAEVFRRVVGLGAVPQLVVSTGDLQSRLNQWVRLESLRAARPSSGSHGSTLHSRPNLPNQYVAPGNQIERTLAGIWEELLGIEQVGIHDDFFALGGHSLLATQLMSRLRATFQVELPLRVIFEAPTIAGVTLAIAQRQVEQADRDRLAQLLAEIKQLSKSEVDSLLAARNQLPERVYQ